MNTTVTTPGGSQGQGNDVGDVGFLDHHHQRRRNALMDRDTVDTVKADTKDALDEAKHRVKADARKTQSCRAA